MAEWLKALDCKSNEYFFVGSNPTFFILLEGFVVFSVLLIFIIDIIIKLFFISFFILNFLEYSQKVRPLFLVRLFKSSNLFIPV